MHSDEQKTFFRSKLERVQGRLQLKMTGGQRAKEIDNKKHVIQLK